jgi:hypothetical protein
MGKVVKLLCKTGQPVIKLAMQMIKNVQQATKIDLQTIKVVQQVTKNLQQAVKVAILIVENVWHTTKLNMRNITGNKQMLFYRLQNVYYHGIHLL